MVIHGRVWKWKVKVLVVQSCPTLCGPMDCSSPNSSVHGFLQARILEWRAIPFSRDLPVGSHVRHYWQNGGTAPAPLIPQARTQDEGIRPCNSDLFFPLLGWVDQKGILRCLLFLRGAWEGTVFCSCAQKIIHKVNHWHLFKNFYKRVFQDGHIGCSLRPWEGLLSEAYLWEECLWQRSLLNLGLRNN